MFHIPFDILASVIYGTELVMWIGIMICGVVLGRGEKESPTVEGVDENENEQDMEMEMEMELPRVESPGARAPSVTSRISGQSSVLPLAPFFYASSGWG